jgi:hypothetical protein
MVPQGMDAGIYQRIMALTRLVKIPSYSLSAPAPTPEDRGRTCIIRDANGVDVLYVCLLTSSGVYQWWPVVQSS